MIATSTLAMHRDPKAAPGPSGGGAIRPPGPSLPVPDPATPRPPRSASTTRRPCRTAARPTRSLLLALLLALGLGLGPTPAQALKPLELRVTPAPFTFGPLTVACDLEAGRAETPLPDPSGPRPRLRFRVSGPAREPAWETEWREAPLAPAGHKTAVAAVLLLAPDSLAAARIDQLTVAVQVDDGGQKIRTRKQTFYRWRDGRFHDCLERAAEPAPWPQTSIGRIATSAPAPTLGPPTFSAPSRTLPGLRKSWGAVKVLYRSKTRASRS